MDELQAIYQGDHKMNYPANTTKWKPGDIVIHDADSKNHKMLMVVLGTTTHPDGSKQWRSQYLNPEKIVPNCLIRKYGSFDCLPKRIKKDYIAVYENDVKNLYNPAIFLIDVTEKDLIRAKELAQ